MASLEQINNIQTTIKEESKQKRFKDGRDWIGNMVEEWKNIKPIQDHWKEVRNRLNSSYLPLFDSTKSRTIKDLLASTITTLPQYHFLLSLSDFNKLKEEDFKDLKKLTSTLLIRACDPGKLLLAILYKKEIEHYSIDFKLSDQSIKDIFIDSESNEYYSLSF